MHKDTLLNISLRNLLFYKLYKVSRLVVFFIYFRLSLQNLNKIILFCFL